MKNNIFSLIFAAGISFSVVPSGFCSELMDEVIAKSRSRSLVKSENAQTINGLRIGHYICQNATTATQATNNGQRRIEQLGEWKDYIMCMSSVFLALDILFDPRTSHVKKDVFITEFNNVFQTLQPVSGCTSVLLEDTEFSEVAAELSKKFSEVATLSEDLLNRLKVTLECWAVLKTQLLDLPDDWTKLSQELMGDLKTRRTDYSDQEKYLLGKRDIGSRLMDLGIKLDSMTNLCSKRLDPIRKACRERPGCVGTTVNVDNLESIESLCDDASFKLLQLADLSSEIEIMDEIVKLKDFFDENFPAEVECMFCSERVSERGKENLKKLPRWKRCVYNPCRNDEELRALGPMTAFYVLASRLNPNLVFYLAVGENEVFSLGNWAVRVARATNNANEMMFQTNLAANLIAAGLKYETIALRQAGLLSLVFDDVWRGRLSNCKTSEQAQKLLEACQKKIRLEAFDFLRSDNDIKIILNALTAMYTLPMSGGSQAEAATQTPTAEVQKPENEIEEEEEVGD